MVAVCLPSRPRLVRRTSPSRMRVNRFNRRAPRTTPAAMATATSVINTATTPCGSTISFMNSDARMGTYSENRNHSDQHGQEDQRDRAVGHRGDQHFGRGQHRDHLQAMGWRRGHRSTPPGQVALNGRRVRARCRVGEHRCPATGLEGGAEFVKPTARQAREGQSGAVPVARRLHVQPPDADEALGQGLERRQRGDPGDGHDPYRPVDQARCATAARRRLPSTS